MPGFGNVVLPWLLRLGSGVGGSAVVLTTAWKWGDGDLSDWASPGLALTLQLDDASGDDVTTWEESDDVVDFSADGSCAWRAIDANGTAIGNLGGDATLSGYRVTAKYADDGGDNVECVLPPEEEAPTPVAELKVYHASNPSGPWTLAATHTLTTSWQTFTGTFAGSPSAHYVKLLLTRQWSEYDSNDVLGSTVYLSDVELTGTLAAAEDAGWRSFANWWNGGHMVGPPIPELASPGLDGCEGGQVTLWILDPVAGATYYELWRYTDANPAPGVLIYSGDRPTEGDPFVDSPRAIGETVYYRARACDEVSCGAWSGVLTATPCPVDGTIAACACTWTPRTPDSCPVTPRVQDTDAYTLAAPESDTATPRGCD